MKTRHTTIFAVLLFVIHGGGWRNGNKERLNRFVDTAALLKERISVVSIHYRYIRECQRFANATSEP